MTITLPPGAVLLSVMGVRGPPDHAAVLAAIRRRDQAAHVQADWPRGLVTIQSDQTPEALRLAVQDAGFIAAWLPYPPRETTARGAIAAITGALGLGFAGFVLGTLTGGVVALLLIAVTEFGGSGDSGGGAMGIPVVAIGAGFIGGVTGLLLAVFRRRQDSTRTTPSANGRPTP